MTPGEAFRKHMFFTHYRVDARMVREYYYKSGSTIDWLMDMGVQFDRIDRAFSASEATRHTLMVNSHGMLLKMARKLKQEQKLFAIPGLKGEGIKMAWEAGAGKEPIIMELMYQLPDNMNHFILDGAFRQPAFG